jgi:hypothetical protein
VICIDCPFAIFCVNTGHSLREWLSSDQMKVGWCCDPLKQSILSLTTVNIAERPSTVTGRPSIVVCADVPRSLRGWSSYCSCGTKILLWEFWWHVILELFLCGALICQESDPRGDLHSLPVSREFVSDFVSLTKILFSMEIPGESSRFSFYLKIPIGKCVDQPDSNYE